MTKKFISISISVVALAFCLAFVDNDSVQKSDGGPPYNTNAPLEKTCSGSEGANSCHSGGIPDNSGPGTPNILFSGGSVYVPGQTYTITPTITHPTVNRFGFQIVSLQDNNNLFTGTINLLDTAKTRQQQPTWGPGQDRIFVMHRLAGTYPTTPNVGQWSYEWTAPSTSVGNISFYACFNAANNNNTNDPGDQTYWKKITISPSAVGITSLSQNKPYVAVYPSPANEMINIELLNVKVQEVELSIVDVQGRILKKINPENEKQIIDVSGMENGLYSIIVTENHKMLALKKVIVQH